GPDTASAVTLTDTLPSGLAFVAATPSCQLAAGTVTCAAGDVASGEAATASITVSVAPSAEPGVTNAASGASTTGDPDATHNQASVHTDVRPAADLSLSNTDDADPVTVGGSVTYTLTTSNSGPDPAADVIVIDTLPAGVTFASASTSCLHDDVTVSCRVGNLA